MSSVPTTDSVQDPAEPTIKPVPRKPVPRKRIPAEERREQVLVVAREIIAREGMHGASTAEIAREAGMSHAYLFRLFPKKEDLLIAVAVDCGRSMHRQMIGAGEQARAMGQPPMPAMAAAFQDFLNDRTRLQVNLQAIAAAQSVPALGEVLREAWGRIVGDIERVSEATVDEVRAFVAQGMLLQMIAGLGAESADWVTRLHHGPLPCEPGQLDGATPAPGS